MILLICKHTDNWKQDFYSENCTYRTPCYPHTSQILQNFPGQQKQICRPYTDRKNWFLRSEKLRSLVLLILCICFCFFFFSFLAQQPPGGASSFTGFLDHTQQRKTVDKTPLNEWLARRRDYLTRHNKLHSQQTGIHAFRGILTHNLSKRAAADLSLTMRGQCDQVYLLLPRGNMAF